jgi:hypothetical protein
MPRGLCFGLGILVGAILALLVGVGRHWFLNRRTTVLVARSTVELESGITLPKGTQLIHHASVSEGFDTLALYVNVPKNELKQRFESRIEQRPFLEIPYWIRRR